MIVDMLLNALLHLKRKKDYQLNLGMSDISLLSILFSFGIGKCYGHYISRESISRYRKEGNNPSVFFQNENVLKIS